MKRRITVSAIASLLIIAVFSAGVFAASGLERISAYLNNDISVTIDGKAWTPPSALITYEGSTWLPLRALGDALGAGITYDGATKTVGITSGSGAGSGTGTVSSGTNVEYYFTRAGDKPEQALIDVIKSAEKTLDIAIYSLTHPDIVAAIRDAAKAGVTVRLIEDRLQASGKSQTSALKILGSAGVALMQNKHSGLMHLKMTIADGKVATGGSFNYSKNAATNSDEVLTVYRDSKLVSDFTKRFNEMWNDTSRFETIERTIAMEPEESEPEYVKSPPVTTPTEPVTSDPVVSTNCDKPAIKGNRNSKIFHAPGQRDYEKTTANVEYFCTEKEAVDAGYRKAAR